MGYTHYWMTTNSIDKNTWGRIRAVAQRVLEQPDLPELRGAYLWSSAPQITDELVRFNGTGDDAGYEFCLSGRTIARRNQQMRLCISHIFARVRRNGVYVPTP